MTQIYDLAFSAPWMVIELPRSSGFPDTQAVKTLTQDA